MHNWTTQIYEVLEDLFIGHTDSSYCTGKMRHCYLQLVPWFVKVGHILSYSHSSHIILNIWNTIYTLFNRTHFDDHKHHSCHTSYHTHLKNVGKYSSTCGNGSVLISITHHEVQFIIYTNIYTWYETWVYWIVIVYTVCLFPTCAGYTTAITTLYFAQLLFDKFNWQITYYSYLLVTLLNCSTWGNISFSTHTKTCLCSSFC